MKRFSQIVLVAVCFSLVVFVLSSFHARPANAQARSAPVEVTNTPLPVTGSVNVGNLPTNQMVNFNGTAQPVSLSTTAFPPARPRRGQARAASVYICFTVSDERRD